MSTAEQDAKTVEVEVPQQEGAAERRRRSRLRVPLLTVVYHPDVSRVGERLWLSPLASGGEVLVSRLAPGFAAPGEALRRPLGDRYLSRTPLALTAGDEEGGVRLVRGGGTLVSADGVAVEKEASFSAAALERGVVLELARRLVLLLHGMPPLPSEEPPRFGMVGDSEPLLRLREAIQRVADLEVPVLLRGETGTGKELAALAIHRASRRRERPWVSVNMAAVPPTLAASELFGAVRGAFTGSDRDRVGYFRHADGGTLFLDEVGEAPLEVQVPLLRALETGEIQAVGAAGHRQVDVRVIAATDVDLEAAIDSGSFRAPLFHRLAGYSIRVPTLTERRDDIGRLLVHFLRGELGAVGELARLEPASSKASPWLPASIVSRLVRYDWPGNVRELRNVVRQMVIESRGSEHLEVGPQLEEVLRAAVSRSTGDAGPTAVEKQARTPARRPAAVYRSPAEVSEEELLAALRLHRWSIKPAAAELRVSRASLYNLMERSPRVRKASDLEREEIEACRENCGGDLEAMVDELEVSKSGLVLRMKELELA